MTVAALEQRLAEIVAAVEKARHALADGVAIDLTGLDEAIAGFCEQAKAADPASRPGIAAAIAPLQAALDALSADLARQHQSLHLKRATAAYGGESSP